MKKSDAEKLSQLHQQILEFNHQRGWDPSAQNIAKSIVIEAAELLEHFQWDNGSSTKEKDLIEIGNEAADVIWYLFLLCQRLDINIIEAISRKLEHNQKKYPVEMFKGQRNDEFYYSQKKKYRQDKSLE